MKLTCEKQKLSEAVLNLQHCVSTKSTIPALEGILVKAENGQLKLCGYDLELGITTSFEAQVEEEGSVVLSARLFGDIVRRLPENSVSLQTDAKQVTQIESGEAKFSVLGIPAEEYPEMPEIGGETSLSIEQKTLKSMIRQTIFAIAQNDIKPVHTGSLFEVKDGKIRIISVDGYRVAVREEPLESDLNDSFIVPGKTLSEVVKLLDDSSEEKAEITTAARHILFRIGGYTVVSRLLEGDFLDYRTALPKTELTQVRVSTQKLTGSVERVSLVITERLKNPVSCTVNEEGIRVSCVTTIGRASDRAEAKVTGQPVEIGFNSTFLTDALRSAECDEVRMVFAGPLSPIKILPPEGESFLFLVLPVRLKNSAE